MTVSTKTSSYPVICVDRPDAETLKVCNLQRRVCILTDSGVPKEYSERLLPFCKEGYILTVPEGEKNKNFASLERVLTSLAEHRFSRKDCIVAVGGGVVCDLGGLCAALYMRGIDVYYFPTTVLAAVDASVGGKCAIDLGNYKNTVGVFRQPCAVIYDVSTAETLPRRQIASGLAEALKMGLSLCAPLAEYVLSTPYSPEMLRRTVEQSVKVKADVVEADERESGIRRVLNFGHTFGHAIESAAMGELTHGECVALGLLPLIPDEEYRKVKTFLEKYGMPQSLPRPIGQILPYMEHDKKADGEWVDVILVPRLGEYEIRKMKLTDFGALLREHADRWEEKQ